MSAMARPKSMSDARVSICSRALGQRGLGPLGVYLVGTLGRVGEDGDLVADDLHEAAADGDEALLAVLDDADLPRRQGRKKRRVTRQDSQLSVNSGSDEPVDLFG